MPGPGQQCSGAALKELFACYQKTVFINPSLLSFHVDSKMCDFLQLWKGMSWTSAAVLTSCNSLHLAGPRHCCLNCLNLVVMYIVVVKVLVQLMLECLLKDDTKIRPGSGKFLCVQKGPGSCRHGTGQHGLMTAVLCVLQSSS